MAILKNLRFLVYNINIVKKFVFLVMYLFSAALIFSQTDGVREQGLLTMEPVWRQALGGAVLSLPSVQAQSAVVALDGGNIRAYSTAGNFLWDYFSRGRISPYITRSREGTSYLSRTNGILIAVNRSGRELWQRNIGSPLVRGVIVGWDGRLFVPVEGRILCFTASGNLLWTRVFESPFSVSPTLDRGGGIIFALANNEVYRISPFGHTQVWVLSNTPAALVSVGYQKILVIYTDGTMEILGRTEEWFLSARSDAQALVLPRLASGALAAAGMGSNAAIVLADGTVAFLSLDERRVLWSGDSHIREFTRTGGRPDLQVELIFDERGIYILSRNGATAFSHDGRRRWYKFLQNTAAIPAFGTDGILYVGRSNWILYAYKIEDRILSERLSAYGFVPAGSYGMGSPNLSFRAHFPVTDSELNFRLEQIAWGISAGMVGTNEPVWKSILMTIASGRSNIQNRIRALQLIGQIGSLETIPWLVNFFRNEAEPAVSAAAIYAIGNIGVDPQGIALQAFLFYLSGGSGIREEQVLSAIASATGALCRFSGPPLSVSGIRVLSMLTSRNQPRNVSDLARRELASLR